MFQALEADFKVQEEINIEYHYTLQQLSDALTNLRKWMQPSSAIKPWANVADDIHVVAEPLGVVLIISPWNFPFGLSFMPLIGVIAAGNCCVIKTSEMTPRSATVIRLIVEKYLDPQCFQVLTGAVEVSTEALKLKWDHILYTGNR